MSDIFKEVDDALKKEKVEAFWSKYGNLVIGLILAIIIGTGIYSFYNSWKSSVNEEKTAIILNLQNNQEEFNASNLETLNANQKSLAELFVAKNYLQNNQEQQAFEIFNAIRQDTGVETNIRGLATLYARNMIINQVVEGNLSDITLSTPSIWDNHFKMQDALHLGSQENQTAEAIQLLEEIIQTTPENQTLLQQAQQLKYVYEYDHQQKGQ